MSRNNDYTTGSLLDFSYFKENYRLIAIDLSTQTKLKDPQQTNLIHRRERQGNKNNVAKIFFITEKSEETKLLLTFYKILWTSYQNWKRKRLQICWTVLKMNSLQNLQQKWKVIDSESNGSYSHHDPIKFL